jgi:hypothetical protein
MDAKEYYKQFDTEDITGAPEPDYSLSFYQNIFRLMESYHQAKSKEEAEERYKDAWEWMREEFPDNTSIQHALRLAAFGKEGEG